MSEQEQEEKSTVELRKQVEEVMRHGAGLVRNSNGLPKRGAEFEIYNSYPTYNAFMKRQEERLNLLMSKITKSIGCPMRVPNVGSSIQEYSECVIEAQDNITERASTLLEALQKADRDEVVKVPEFILKAAPTNNKTEKEVSMAMRTFSANIGSILAQKFRERREEAAQIVVSEKPQKTYNLMVDNSVAPFISKLKEKHHAVEKRKGIVIIDDDSSGKPTWNAEDDAEIEHPYIAELLNFKPIAEQLESKEMKKFDTLQNTKFTMVDTVEKLKQLCNHLNNVTEFAVDLEHNETRSYLGLTCLIQISTRDADWIVDPFPIWDHVGMLNEPFTNPKILKVLHGSDNDVLWLQRDFGIHIVNLFDTYVAMKKLRYPKFSLAYLVSRFASIPLDKQYQLADWRARPLREAMINYAREDTHYLLYCYDNLRQQLIEQNEADLRDVYSECIDLCVKVYKKPVFNPFGYTTDIKFRFTLNSRQEYALTHLYKWRDNVARDEDESPLFVLPNYMLLALSETLPNDINGIYACCNPLPHYVKQRTGEILKIIREARDVKLEKREKSSKQVEDAQESRGVMNDRMDLITSILHSKLDFSHCRFDEERGEIVIDKDESSLVEHKKLTMLSILRPAIVDDKDLTVIEGDYTKKQRQCEEILRKLDEWVTPYECYKIVMKEKEKQEEADRLEAERLKSLESDGPKKMFSHNDPTVCRKPVFHDDKIAETGEIQLAGGNGGSKSDNNDEPIFDDSRFSEDQLMSKKSLKRKRKEAKRHADISTVLGDDSQPSPSTESPVKNAKKSRNDEAEEDFDYEKEDISTFQKPVSDKNADFDPFHQKFRVKNQSKKQTTTRKSANRQGRINYKKE